MKTSVVICSTSLSLSSIFNKIFSNSRSVGDGAHVDRDLSIVIGKELQWYIGVHVHALRSDRHDTGVDDDDCGREEYETSREYEDDGIE